MDNNNENNKIFDEQYLMGKISENEFNYDRFEKLDVSNCGITNIYINSRNVFHSDNLRFNRVFRLYFHSMDSIIELNLGSNQIKKIDPHAFEDFRWLEKLDLSDCKIETISDEAFIGLDSLRELNIGSNDIYFIDKKTFLGLENLEKLELSNCGINKISNKEFIGLINPKNEEEITNMNINKIDIIDSNCFKSLPKLKELNLQNQRICLIQTKTFENLKNINRIDMQDNYIEMLVKETFVNLPNLFELQLSNNKISQIELNTFESTPNIEKIYLRNNNLKVLNKIVFENVPKLKELYLDSNSFKKVNSFDGIEKLDILDFSWNRISDIESLVFEQPLKLYLICNRIKSNQITASNSDNKLNELYLHENRIIKINFDRFANLTRLDLSNNKICTIFGFKNLKNLEILWLQDNFLSQIPNNSFEGLNNLKELNLNGNEIQEIHLSVFSHLPKLEILDLGRNEIKHIIIDDEHINIFSNLQVLFLNHNELTKIDENTFKGTFNLKILNLDDNLLEKINRNCFDHFNSSNIGLISLYQNKESYWNKSVLSAELSIYINQERMIKNNKFLSDWNEFLNQFQN